MASTLLVLVQMIEKIVISEVYKSIQNLTKSETLDFRMIVVSFPCHDADETFGV